jgi:hypothetical protein
VGGLVAVQVPDLATADPERELTAPARACGHTRPGGDLLGDPFSRSLSVLHNRLLAVPAADATKATS